MYHEYNEEQKYFTEKIRESLLNLESSLPKKDQVCYGCVYFRWKGAGVGPPENTPHTNCEFLDMSRSCGYPKTVPRLLECIIGNYKDNKEEKHE